MDEEELNVCRTCLKKFNKREKPLSIYKISDLLMSYISVKILENDGLPSTICNSCHGLANQAYKFKLLCEESDRKLRKNLSTNITVKKGTFCDNDNSLSSFDINNFNHSPNSLVDNLDCPIKIKMHTEQSMDYTSFNGESCNRKSEETRHKSDSKVLKCRFCSMTFIHRTRLLKHEMKHENGIKCSICGKDYATVKQLASHISIHNRKGAHLCQTCGKQFTMPENLVRHQRIHMGIRPYKCKLCNKSFTQSNELKSHMITHSSEKTHLCNVCGNKYARHMSLQVHMRRLHSDSSLIRPYQCDICGRAFKDKRDLSQHNSIHKGERRHICKICNKAFNRSSNLKVHERIHSGYRPFVCHICQKAFIQKHVLNTHMKTHPTGS